jgi:uncharacterized protein
MPDETIAATRHAPSRSIHLLYVPTLFCNLSCSYCYLGDQTSSTSLKEDSARAVSTFRHALNALRDAGVLAFNVSLHGGEVTTLPPAVLEELFSIIRAYYLENFDAINALGHSKRAPHIKTNLFKFAPLYDLFVRNKVSISASIDLPLGLHAKHRITQKGNDWLERTLDNIRLLARYPHNKKISTTISAEHLLDIPKFIEDIWFIHRELGFDMNNFNLMFAFSSGFNAQKKGTDTLTPTTSEQQLQLYEALTKEFTGTELEEGLHRNWFDEFKPSYCTNAFNCGDRFYLLQNDGTVYSCVRGQGLEEFRYGNIYEDSINTILANGARKISVIHQQHGFDPSCQRCDHLALCNSGCPVVKYHNKSGLSYTCDLQKLIYRDNPLSYPAATTAKQQEYARRYAHNMHPALAFEQEPALPTSAHVLPNEYYDDKYALRALIDADPVLKQLYTDSGMVLELSDEMIALVPQILKPKSTRYTLIPGDRMIFHIRRELLSVNCPETVRNTIYMQMLRDTTVVYGDEQRTKQEHVFTYQVYNNFLQESTLGKDWLMVDIGGIIDFHRIHYLRGVSNNLFFSTSYLRDYHYEKQKKNAFYHIQAMNLPFQNFEFYYLPEKGDTN